MARGNGVQTAVSTTGLVKAFGTHRAVDGIDLVVPERSVFGFLGQNGAGKTTTMRLLLGLLKPTAGSIQIFGLDVATQRQASARNVGAIVETPCHYDHLTGRENLDISRRLITAPKADLDRVLGITELADAADRPVKGYSLGMRQRLGLARALLGSPKLLILDEPTNGLDPNGIRDMRDLIRALPEREGVTILVSSHILAEVEQVATHVALMHAGRLLLQAPVAELMGAQSSTVRFRVDQADALKTLLTQRGIASHLDELGRVCADQRSAKIDARDLASINAELVQRGVAVSEIHTLEPNLEQIFVQALVRAEAA
jgi:ABC-2 type transport system ATP-binding protein